MKQVQLIGVVACAGILIGCETTQTAGTGNQERKRLAQIQKQQAEANEYDQSELNLWNAQQDRLFTGTNPAINYR